MPREERRLTRGDILPLSEYVAERRAHRARIAAIKRHHRLEVGPFAAFYFENYDTMWHQVHEMLAIEKGGEAQIEDELLAYNPLIPQKNELSATVMFEIDDPARRARELSRLGGIENATFIEFGGERIRGEPDRDRENTSPEGRASAVQFVKFRLSPEEAARFEKPNERILVGFDHKNYGHIATLPEEVRRALAQDLE